MKIWRETKPSKNYKCKDAMAGPSMGKEEKAGQCDQNIVNEAGNKWRHDGRARQEPGHLGQRNTNIFFIKDHPVNILGFMGHTIFVSTPQFCPCDGKVATDHLHMIRYGYIQLNSIYKNRWEVAGCLFGPRAANVSF